MFTIARLNLLVERIVALVKGLQLEDGWNRAERQDILLISSDLDKSEMTESNRRFDRLLDSIRIIVRSDSLKVSHIGRPVTLLRRTEAWSPIESCNRGWVIGLLLDFVTSLGFGRYFRTNFFKRVLRRLEPQVVLTIGGQPELFRAARQLQISAIEILHGHGYLTFEGVFGSRKPSNQPSSIWALDKDSKKNLQNEGWFTGDIEVIGDVWSEMTQVLDNPKFPSLATLGGEEFLSRFKKVILVSLQWSYSGERSHYANKLSNGLYPELLDQLIDSVGAQALWLIRIHPVTLYSRRRSHVRAREKIAKQFSSRENVDWFNSSRIPLGKLEPLITHHITMSSSTMFITSKVGIPTWALDSKNTRRFLDVEESERSGFLSIHEGDHEKIMHWLDSTNRTVSSGTPLRLEPPSVRIRDLIGAIATKI